MEVGVNCSIDESSFGSITKRDRLKIESSLFFGVKSSENSFRLSRRVETSLKAIIQISPELMR